MPEDVRDYPTRRNSQNEPYYKVAVPEGGYSARYGAAGLGLQCITVQWGRGHHSCTRDARNEAKTARGM
jgi:hypothetical protein